ncbi:LLM class oxidoreductase [Pseudomonas auratipiscis]|uniref:LLM class oxidoreductase n=1 Tax=Pseudomonas auratipiscis TaxID=3115853 RepID=A0AB35WPT8_9PSED|nr:MULTISPECIES: LLM class oxidoreductase [unclassified Pseudomonas]MEE1866402.1 LLM class oxidoreductase [Pseudomonas sp. 120P]MEE1960183.1 LLM class oxidoreductase [Pseudomonas sp. 119P]
MNHTVIGNTPATSGASAPAFVAHPGYQRMFAAGELTLGMFLPLRFYQGDLSVLAGQADLVGEIDRLGFAAVWVRDVPLFDPSFGDAGQVFDPFTYLAYLAAKTKRIALATGSAIFSLRHPIDLAKAASTIDQLSGGRLVMGIASGDRPVEFPAYGLEHSERGERFADAVDYFRQLLQGTQTNIASSLGNLSAAQLLPRPATGNIPLLVTGSSRQSMPWLAEHADGWLTYPQATHSASGPRQLAEKIQAWRSQIPDQGFRPHVTNEWIDLDEDANFPRTPLRGGYVLRTGRKGLIELLGEWRDAGVNHAALGIHLAQRPAQEIIQELGEEVLPLFPAHTGPLPLNQNW